MEIIYNVVHGSGQLEIPHTAYVPIKGDVIKTMDNKYYEVVSRQYCSSHDSLAVFVSPIELYRSEIPRTSQQWMKEEEFAGTVIMDADGWDRGSVRSFDKSFYIELITREEMRSRISKSTIKINNI